MLKVVIVLKLGVCNTEGLIASDAHNIAFFSGQSVDLEQSDLWSNSQQPKSKE